MIAGVALAADAVAGEVALWVSALVGAYLVGSIPWSWLVVRWLTGKDVRDVGSGNVGATNAMRAAGRGAGAAALLLDVAKGVVPVAAVRALGAPPLLVSCVAALAVIGHMFPVWLRFRGGKGVATAAGALGALAPVAAGIAAAVFALVVAVTRYVSLGSIAAMVAFPILVLLLARFGSTSRDVSFLVSSAVVPALIVWRHRGNIARLLAGTERRLGERRRAAAAAREDGP